MKEVNQNRLLGVFGVALIAVGLLGYTGTLGKISSQATVIIETDSTVTDISTTTDSLTELPSSPYDYWQEGMSNWTDMTEGTEFDSDKPVYFMVTWMNATDSSTVIGHAELTVTKPDSSTVSPSADEGQDVSCAPNEGHMVSFKSVSGPQGDYQLSFNITGEYGTTPEGYFTINGQKVTKNATITLQTNDLTFVFHPTKNESAINRVEVGISDPISGGEGESGHNLNLTEAQGPTGMPVYSATDTLADGKYSITGRFYTGAGDKFVAMSIKGLTTGEEKANKTLWFAPMILGFLVFLGAVSRQYD